jgi:hypothetical protein
MEGINKIIESDNDVYEDVDLIAAAVYVSVDADVRDNILRILGNNKKLDLILQTDSDFENTDDNTLAEVLLTINPSAVTLNSALVSKNIGIKSNDVRLEITDTSAIAHTVPSDEFAIYDSMEDPDNDPHVLYTNVYTNTKDVFYNVIRFLNASYDEALNNTFNETAASIIPKEFNYSNGIKHEIDRYLKDAGQNLPEDVKEELVYEICHTDEINNLINSIIERRIKINSFISEVKKER